MNKSILKNQLITRVLIVFITILFSTAGARTGGENDNNNDNNGTEAWEKETISAIVTNIDRSNNQMTLKDDDGDVFTVTLDKRVDLSRIDNGDKVKVELYRSLATDFHEPTQQERENPLIITDQTIESPEGTEPAEGNLKQIQAVVQIIDIDEDDQEVTVMGPQGNEFELFVSDPSLLENLKEGDSMTVIYSESLVVSIEKM